MPLVSYTIYRREHDPARGTRPTMVGLTVKPTPSLTLSELKMLIAELQAIADKMD